MEQWDSSSVLGNADVFNIGSSKEVSVLELANKISSNIIHIPERLGEAKNNLCSYQKFFNATIWTPSVDVLEWLETQ